MYRGWETIIAAFVFGSFLSYVAAVTIAASSMDAYVSAWTSQIILCSYLGASAVGLFRIKVTPALLRSSTLAVFVATISKFAFGSA
jgi:hypothetical protein